MTISTPTPVRLNECLTTPAHVAATAVGPIQYAERGHGPAALSVHGTPGGYDQGLVGLEFASTALRLIAPSRPGYLGTPLSTRADSRPAGRCPGRPARRPRDRTDPRHRSIWRWPIDLPAGRPAP